MAPPSLYTFNHNLAIDVFEIGATNGARFSILSIVDTGTSFHQAAVVSVGGGQPSSHTCWKKFQKVWAQWAGFPVMITTDRGLHNRGSFARGMTANGVYMRQAALESPWQLGKGERHGGILKILMKKLITDQGASTKDEIKSLLSTALITKNGFMKRGGFTASQWVLGKLPREPGAILNDMRSASSASSKIRLMVCLSSREELKHVTLHRRPWYALTATEESKQHFSGKLDRLSETTKLETLYVSNVTREQLQDIKHRIGVDPRRSLVLTEKPCGCSTRPCRSSPPLKNFALALRRSFSLTTC